MLRDTMIRTMPVAMIAMPEAWTERVIRLAGWMNLPPDRMWKPTRMAISAISIPNSRMSISVAPSSRRSEVPLTGCV